MTPPRRRRVLLTPESRPGRPADVATRVTLIANQRRPARRRRRVRRALRLAGRAAVGMLALGALGLTGVVAVHWLRQTPLLAVTTLEVQGLHRLPVADVRAAAGVKPGQSLLTLDVRVVEAGVEGLPGVRRARAVRHLPHRLTLMVEEREPFALVNGGELGGRGDAGGLYWIDAEGFLVGSEPHPPVPGLPILSGVARPAPGPGQTPSATVRSGLALLRAVQRAGGRVAGRISEIDLASADAPVLYLTDGAEVRVGSEGWGERLARLDAVLGDLDSHGERVTSVDLRFRDLVVLKPRSAVAPGSDPRGAAPGRWRRTDATMSGANPREPR